MELNNKKIIYILTLNFLNQALIIGFHLGFSETSLHRNKGTFIYTFIIDVIVRVPSTFLNLKFHLFIEINYSKTIHCYLFFNCE
jgi:hypothetical protein